MQKGVRDPWSPHSSGRSSPSTSAPTSEAHFSGDADDELTASEDTASVVPSGVASDLHTRSDSASIYSYSSSTHHLTRDIHGRTFNNVNDYYMLPGA
ncbi:hypothetical protein FRC04_009923 [Tulasnella sp. 424]|nr:hypothetical protein FRC04_009923 [Tulasnella sp. 424]